MTGPAGHAFAVTPTGLVRIGALDLAAIQARDDAWMAGAGAVIFAAGAEAGSYLTLPAADRHRLLAHLAAERERVAALEAAGDALRSFTKHDPSCLIFVVTPSAHCTCGWAEAAAAWRAARQEGR
jgi:hypothetical protein